MKREKTWIEDAPYVVVVALIVISFVATGCSMGIITMDVIKTRSLQCQNVIVSNTTMYDTSSFYVTVDDAPRLVLGVAEPGVIKRWGRIEPNDTVYMKLGDRTVEFC